MKRFAVRTVRPGTVRIGGVLFRPDDCYQVYDGRLDGQRFAFGRYVTADVYEPYVSLWGTEAAYRGQCDPGTGPELVDGGYPWMHWRADS